MSTNARNEKYGAFGSRAHQRREMAGWQTRRLWEERVRSRLSGLSSLSQSDLESCTCCVCDLESCACRAGGDARPAGQCDVHAARGLVKSEQTLAGLSGRSVLCGYRRHDRRRRGRSVDFVLGLPHVCDAWKDEAPSFVPGLPHILTWQAAKNAKSAGA